MKKDRKGFTLTEMIVVIAIIGILAAVLIPSVVVYVNRAQLSNDQQLAASMTDEIERYCIENNIDQEDLTGLDIRSILQYKEYNLETKSNNYTYMYNKSNKTVEVVKIKDINVIDGQAKTDIMEVQEGYFLVGMGDHELEVAVNYLASGDFNSFTDELSDEKFSAYENYINANYNPSNTLYLDFLGVKNVTLSETENAYTKVVFCQKTNFLINYQLSLDIIKDEPKLSNNLFIFVAAGAEELADKLGINGYHALNLSSVGSSISCQVVSGEIEKLTDKLNLTFDSDYSEIDSAGGYLTAAQLQTLSFTLGEDINVATQLVSSFSAINEESGIWKLSVMFVGIDGIIGYDEIIFTRF